MQKEEICQRTIAFEEQSVNQMLKKVKEMCHNVFNGGSLKVGDADFTRANSEN